MEKMARFVSQIYVMEFMQTSDDCMKRNQASAFRICEIKRCTAKGKGLSGILS